MALLASDIANPEFFGARNPDSVLSVWFLSRPVQSPFLTEKQGRPIFNDVAFIHIESPGDRNSIIERPIYESDKQRFPLQWAAYDNAHGKDPKEVGTQLSAWPLVGASQAEELRAMKFRTVESIAGASDAALQNLGMLAGMAPFAFRERARAFLAAAQDSALVENQALALKKAEEKETHMQAQLAELREQVAKLTEIAMAPEPKIQKRRGRPPKHRPAV